MTDHREKIDTLQALRCLAFLAVFAAHTGFRMAEVLGTGRWGVSMFLMLSGFTMVYSYYDRGRLTAISLRDNLHFAFDKLKGLYPLYVVVTLAMMAYLVAGEHAISLGRAMIALALNLLLVQEFLPLSVRSICVVAWYLCTVLVSYICFPWILRWMERRYTRRKAILMIVLSVLIVALLGWIGSMMPSDRTVVTPSVWTTDFSNWFIYKCPFVRVWEFFIGCNLGYLYITRTTDHDINRGGSNCCGGIITACCGWNHDCLYAMSPTYIPGWNTIYNARYMVE